MCGVYKIKMSPFVLLLVCKYYCVVKLLHVCQLQFSQYFTACKTFQIYSMTNYSNTTAISWQTKAQ